MQTPNIKTTIPRCLALASYTGRMLGKVSAKPALAPLAQQIADSANALEQANTAYEQSKRAIIYARVDVKYIDFAADGESLNVVRRAELADGRANGPIAKLVAPDGRAALVKPFGQKQVDVLKDLEGRLQAASGLWADAAAEQSKVHAIRIDYEASLAARDQAWQAAKNLRVVRNVAKAKFVAAYVDATLEVKQLFPGDARMQELFFDEVEKDANEPEEAEAPVENTTAEVSKPTGTGASTGGTVTTGTGGTGTGEKKGDG